MMAVKTQPFKALPVKRRGNTHRHIEGSKADISNYSL